MRNILTTLNTDIREKFIHNEAVELREKTIGKCNKCNNGWISRKNSINEETLDYDTFPCKCYREFFFRYEMLISGLGINLSKIMYKFIPEETVVLELDIIKNKIIRKKIHLYEYLNKYLSKIEYVLENGNSFMFVGANSTGKTYASLYLLYNFIKKGKTAHFIYSKDLMEIINNRFSKEDKVTYTSLLQEIINVDLLVVDEVGKETGSSKHISTEIESILKTRESNNKPTVLTTNFDYEEIVEIYTTEQSNFASAFTRSYKVFIFNPKKDFRVLTRKKWDI